jgi:2-succinyl-6-hydroxy-2,4-cyclohexadiene-1-carboxylate synthase
MDESTLACELTLVNLPGHGALTSEYLGPGEFFRELSALCEDALVVGYSMGGRLALWWAMMNPATPRALVLLSTNTAELTDKERENRTSSDESLAQEISTLDHQGYLRFLKNWSQQELFGQRLLSEEAIRLRSTSQPSSVARALVDYSVAKQPAGEAFLASWERPVLILYGERDVKYASIAQGLQPLQHELSRVVELPGAHHDLLYDSPEITMREIGAFIRSLGSSPDLSVLRPQDRTVDP